MRRLIVTSSPAKMAYLRTARAGRRICSRLSGNPCEILLQIDGKDVAAREGMTILEAARTVGVSIPSLCLSEKMEPYGACRICSVEVEARGRTSVVAACLYPVEPNLVVTTRSEKLNRVRKSLIEMMMAMLRIRSR